MTGNNSNTSPENDGHASTNGGDEDKDNVSVHTNDTTVHVPHATTLYSKWKQFVMDYSQYFLKEEPLVIVMPANGAETVCK